MKIVNNIRILVFSFSLVSNLSHADSWAENWFDAATYSSGGSFNTQTRGYVSGGSFSGRLNLSNDYLMSLQAPKISAGCGGIDGFLGGLAFLDEDYLVQKFQNIMQAAPAVAFDLALKAMCKECSETLTKLEAAVNYLNGIQINECALAKKTVAVLDKDDPTTLKDMWTEMSGEESLNEAMDRSWQEAKESMDANNGDPIADLKKTVAMCPRELKEIFDEGYVISNMAENMGAEDFAEIIRGYVGDVVIQSNPEDKIPLAREIEPCAANDVTNVKAMLYGYAEKKTERGVCEEDDDDGGVLNIVQEMLDNISEKIKSGKAFNEEEKNFINNTSTVPVYTMLSTAAKNGVLSETVDSIDEIVALGYSYYMMSSLYDNTARMFRQAKKSINTSTYSHKYCNIELYTPQIEKFKGMQKRLEKTKDAFKESYLVELQNYQTILNQQIQAQKMARDAAKDRARTIQ
jgi:conjugative transfer pilus assembly protein TraH